MSSRLNHNSAKNVSVVEEPRSRARGMSTNRGESRLERVFEAVVIAMSCLAPWAYGAVDAWAEMVLFGGATLLAALRTILDWRTQRIRGPAGGASLLLLGLLLLALVQAAPISTGLLGVVSPSTDALRASLTPRSPETIKGDPGRIISLPAPTISVEPDATIHVAAELAAVLIVFDCVARARGGITAFWRFALALSLNCGLLAIFSLGQTLTWNGKIYGIRPHSMSNGWMTGGPFFCHNHLAAYLNVGLGLTLGLLLHASNEGSGRRKRRTHSFFLTTYAAGLIILGILGSNSRGGLLAMVIALIVSVVLFKRKREGIPWWWLAAVAGFVCVFTVAIGRDAPFQRMATIPGVASSGFNGRSEIWRGAVATWQVNPLLGAGFGTYPVASAPNYELRKYGSNKRFFTHAESEYLELLAEAGIFGLGLAIALLGTICIRSWHASQASSAQERRLVLGGFFGIVATAIQCLADFPLHVAGVTIPVVVLSAFLYQLGDANPREEASAGSKPRHSGGPWVSLWNLALLGAGGLLLVHQSPLAKVEATLARANLPLPGTNWPTVDIGDHPREELERMRDALDSVVRERPNWAEGHLRRGLVMLGLYRYAAAETLEEASKDAKAQAVPEESGADANLPTPNENVFTDPLWLHGIVHRSTPEQLAELGEPIEHEPVLKYMVPATRSFLEARRCSPLLPVPHARLASADFLLEGADSSLGYARRAFKLGGSERGISAFCGQVAANLGEPEFAVQCWQNYLLTRGTDWEWIADSASSILTPDQILEMLRPVGVKYTLLFADRLYGAVLSAATRARFLNAALEQVPMDTTLEPAERLWYEGKARASLGQQEVATKLMAKALNLEPEQKAWRLECIGLLLRWGDQQEAYRQASVGARLHPNDKRFQNAMKSSIDELLRRGERPSRMSSTRD